MTERERERERERGGHVEKEIRAGGLAVACWPAA